MDRLRGRLGPCTLVRREVGALGQRLVEELAWGMGRAVVVARIPTHAAGCGQWQEEELAEVVLAWPDPEETCGERGDGGCGWCDGSVVVGLVVEHSSTLGRLVHTLERCSCIHKGWRLSFL